MAMVKSADFSQKHYACADMVRIDSASASELAMLLEIWESGGIVHSSLPIPAGSPIAIAVENKPEIAAEVTGCEPDADYGYLLNIGVHAPTKWFPFAYIPAWHSSEMDSVVKAGELVC